MKKIFLIPLMALLSCVMAWGVEVSTSAELEAALNGTEPTITLTSDITMTFTKSPSIQKRNVTIDLSGHTLTDGNIYYISVGFKGDVTVQNGFIRVASTNSFTVGTGGKLKFENVKKVANQASNVGTPMYEIGTDVRREPIHVLQQGTLTLDSDCDLNIVGKAVGTITNGGSCTIYYMSAISNNSVKAYLDNLHAAKKIIVPSSIKASLYADYVSYFEQDVKDRMFLTLTGNGNGTETYKLKTTSDKGECKFVRGENTYYFKDLPSAMKYSTNEFPYKLQGDTSLTTLNLTGFFDLNGKTLYLTQEESPIVTVPKGQLTIKNSQPATGSIEITREGTPGGYAFAITPSTKSVANYSKLNIEAGVTINMPYWKGYFLTELYNNVGYGTVLNMNGTVNVPNGSGITLNGNTQAVDPNAPIFNIGGTINAKNIGIYAAGYGVWNISDGARIIGHTGIAIKAGQLSLNGQVIANGDEGQRTDTWGNGVIGSNAALQIESNTSYAGEMEITIGSTANLSSTGWYAIYEYGSANTAVKSIAVNGGLFQGGILISQSLAAKGGFVSGGKWSVDVTANVVEGKAANPISEDPYFFEVGTPTEATAQKDNASGQNAVLVNAAASSDEISEAQSDAGRETAVTSTATNSVVVTENTDVVVAGDKDIVDVKKVTVEGADLTVKEGATLNVGTGAVLIGENATLTVEEGAALVVDGLVYGATADNFVVESSEQKSAIVLFSPETEFIKEDHPKATYRFTSKSFKDGSKWVYQRFGMPTYNGNVTVKEGEGTASAVRSFICTWDYNTNDWGAWSELNKTTGLQFAEAVPFQCYQLGSDNAKGAPVTYDFIVDLMGNANASLNFKAGWNPYANSYTAPIDIKEFLTDVLAEAGTGIDATVYLYKDLGNDTYTWQAINLSNAGKTYRVREDGAMVKKTFPGSIEPMQAFIMKLGAGESEETDINYLNSVYNPAMGIARSAAPARNRASYSEVQIGAFNEKYWDNVSLMEGEQFSADYDNGYDAPKYDNNKGLSLYVTNGNARMERVATDNVEGLFIGIDAPEAGEYTLDFSGVNGMEYKVVDMQTGNVFEIEEDAEFRFYAEAGQNDYRFQLIGRNNAPTAIENTAVNANVKGVYTITGQYVGEDLNVLPKGVYVVNGVKVVK
jgi:hypothetical protein